MIYNPEQDIHKSEQTQESVLPEGALYIARFHQPLIAGEVVLELHPVPYSRYLDYTDAYILEAPVTIYKEFETVCLEGAHLNKEFVVSSEDTFFYSESKDACLGWLEEKQRQAVKWAEYNLQRLTSAKIVEFDENNFVCTQQRQKM